VEPTNLSNTYITYINYLNSNFKPTPKSTDTPSEKVEPTNQEVTNKLLTH
jgi:hypothetical protein